MTFFRHFASARSSVVWRSLVLSALATGAAGAATIGSSSYLHVNLTHIPFSYYDNSTSMPDHHASTVGWGAACPSGSTVRNCFNTIFGNMRAQHVSGVRMSVTFCDSESQAFNTCGGSYSSNSWNPSLYTYQSNWIAKVGDFFSDLNSAGITSVAITVGGDTTYSQAITAASSPNGACWDSGLGAPTRKCCTDTPYDAMSPSTPMITFSPENPYGLKSDGVTPIGHVWATGDNQGYNCSPINPYFIGWTNEFNVLNAVLSAAATAGLNVVELEGAQELFLRDFTAQARMIFDNSAPLSAGQAANTVVDVLSNFRTLMTNNGFNPDYVTWSTTGQNSSSATYNSCLNVYSDYGQNGMADALVEAIVGGPFGLNSDWSSTNGNMVCGGSNISNTYMMYLPNYASQPGLVDMHMYPSVFGASPNSDTDIQDTAATAYGDFTHYLSLASATSSVILIGETWPGKLKDSTCFPNMPLTTPTETADHNVAGFNAEGIASPLSGYTVIWRPWMEMQDAGSPNDCYSYGTTGPGASDNYQDVNYNNAGPYTPTNY